MKKTRKASLKSLVKDADKLFQIKYLQLYPSSFVSGKPAEVIHHFILKSQSNALRYDALNAIPLTHAEHTRHHLSGDPAIVAKILEHCGQGWFDDLQKRRRIKVVFTKEYLLQIIKSLEDY